MSPYWQCTSQNQYCWWRDKNKLPILSKSQISFILFKLEGMKCINILFDIVEIDLSPSIESILRFNHMEPWSRSEFYTFSAYWIISLPTSNCPFYIIHFLISLHVVEISHLYNLDAMHHTWLILYLTWKAKITISCIN